MDWGAAIIDAINASRIMVLVYSAKANESQQIKREVERAVNKGMPLIPFRIEDVPMSKTLEYFISTPHWLDALSGPLQQHLDKLAETTALILEQAGVALAPPPVGRAAQPAPPITSSREIVRGIGGWVKGGQEAPTLSQVFLPKSDKIANVALIAGSVLAILILAQIKLGPIWLLPLGALLVGAGIGSRSGALAVLIFVALGVVGLPVFGGGQSAWSTLGSRGSYMQEALGMMVGLIAATFTVGWLAERRLWDRRFPTAAALALIGVALIYLPGRIWAEILALFMRQASAEISFLPSIPMLVITVAVMTVALPMTWSWLNGKREPKLESSPQELASGSPSNVPEAQTAAAEAEPKT
jgi:biotin transporter BioY